MRLAGGSSGERVSPRSPIWRSRAMLRLRHQIRQARINRSWLPSPPKSLLVGPVRAALASGLDGGGGGMVLLLRTLRQGSNKANYWILARSQRAAGKASQPRYFGWFVLLGSPAAELVPWGTQSL